MQCSKFAFIFYSYFEKWMIVKINILQLPEGGDFEALRCLPNTNFDRYRKLDLNIEPPLLASQLLRGG